MIPEEDTNLDEYDKYESHMEVHPKPFFPCRPCWEMVRRLVMLSQRRIDFLEAEIRRLEQIVPTN